MVTTSQQLVERDVTSLRPYPRNARTHSRKQIRQIAASIGRFGFTNPVLVSDEGEIAGHGRVEAARLLGMKHVPTLALSHLSEAERRAYVLADNKLALIAGWDKEILAIELQAMVDLQFDVEVTGFSLAEIDFVLDEAGEASPEGSDAPEDAVPVIGGHPDDIILDFQAPAAFINDPKTKEEKAIWDQQLQRRKEAQEEVTLYAERFKRTRDPKKNESSLDWWHFEQKMFDTINDNLLQRYRVKLQDRSWQEGASRPGDQKRCSWPGEMA